jgi:hypothetical protein
MSENDKMIKEYVDIFKPTNEKEMIEKNTLREFHKGLYELERKLKSDVNIIHPDKNRPLRENYKCDADFKDALYDYTECDDGDCEEYYNYLEKILEPYGIFYYKKYNITEEELENARNIRFIFTCCRKYLGIKYIERAELAVEFYRKNPTLAPPSMEPTRPFGIQEVPLHILAILERDGF